MSAFLVLVGIYALGMGALCFVFSRKPVDEKNN